MASVSQQLLIATGSSTVSLPADMFAWFRGSDLTGSNGDSVTTWTDQTSNAHNLSSGSGITLDTTGLNSLNVVDCQSANSPNMSFASSIFNALTAGAIFFVAKKDADPAGSTADSGGIMHGSSADPGVSGHHYPFTDGNIYAGWGSTVRKTVGNPSTSLATWHIGNFISASGLWSYWLNGNDGTTPFFTTGTNTVGWQDPGGLFHTQNSSYMDGKCAEIIILNTNPSTARRQQIEGYLANRFGITSVLDAGHPYKSSPPSWP